MTIFVKEITFFLYCLDRELLLLRKDYTLYDIFNFHMFVFSWF